MNKSCWICGGSSESGEHIIKASDIRHVIGVPSTEAPVYLRTGEYKNIRVVGIKDNKLKWKNKICVSCNTKLTAPYDKAWSKLSNYLSKIPHGLDQVNLKFIYKKAYKEDVKHLQLYLIKVLGFAITNADTKFDISSLSKALKNNEAHPDVYITFCYFKNWPIDKILRLSDLTVTCDIYGVVLASISYGIGAWQVSVSYWIKRAPMIPLIEKSFHPTRVNKHRTNVIFFEDEPRGES